MALEHLANPIHVATAQALVAAAVAMSDAMAAYGTPGCCNS